MPWLPKELHEEFLQDQLVAAYRKRLEEMKAEAERRLRLQARTGGLDDVRKAEARIATIEEILTDFTEEESE